MSRTLITAACLMFPLQLAAQELDLSLPDVQVESPADAEGLKKQTRDETWFGMGYERRREETERARFREDASGSSVFTTGAAPAAPSAANSGAPAGRPGGGRRR